MTSPEVDPGNLRRLARAIHLECEREGPDVYRVSGGAEPHTVIVHDPGQGWTCNCIDFGVYGGGCKHLLRVRLARGDATVLRTLQLLVPYPSQRTLMKLRREERRLKESRHLSMSVDKVLYFAALLTAVAMKYITDPAERAKFAEDARLLADGHAVEIDAANHRNGARPEGSR